MRVPNVNWYRVDQVLTGELPESALNHAEKQYFDQARRTYGNLSQQLNTLKPSGQPSAWRHSLYQLFGTSSLTKIAGVGLALGMTSWGIVQLTSSESTTQTGHQAVVATDPEWESVKQTALTVNFDRQGVAKQVANEALRAGDSLGFHLQAQNLPKAYVFVFAVDAGDQLSLIFPSESSANGANAPVLFIPYWDMPYKFLVMTPNSVKGFVVLVSDVLPSGHQQKIMAMKIISSSSTSSIRRRSGEHWIEGHWIKVH